MKNAKKIRGILLWLLITVLSVFAIYVFFGSPALSPEMAMHRKEQSYLLGPSQVIAEGIWNFGGSDRFILGETEYGYCVYEYDEQFPDWDCYLTYTEKTDTVTVISVGTVLNWYITIPEDAVLLPIFAIPESDRAASARLTLTAEYAGEPYEVTTTAMLEQNTYFLLKPDVVDVPMRVRKFWHEVLSGSSDENKVSGTATLELFDREGNLLETIVTEYPATK